MNFLQLSKRYPPVLCRLLAMKGSGRSATVMSSAEIGKRAGTDAATIDLISRFDSWNHLTLGQMVKFLQGCGIDFCDWRRMDRLNQFLKQQAKRDNPWRHLRRSKEWLSYYEPLLKLYAASLK